jgi:membrane-associated protease RseP (regulator of RpoE activity)
MMQHESTQAGRGYSGSLGILILTVAIVQFGGPAALNAQGGAGTKGVTGSHLLLGGGMSSHGTQGYLGVDLRDVSEEQMASLKLKETRGAEIVGVDHDGPACKAGLQVHDIVLQMNGQVIEGEEQLRRMLHDAPPGRQVTFLISRDGQQRTISVQMANREELERQAWEKHYTVPEPPESSSAYVARGGNSFFKSGAPSAAATGAKGSHNLLLGTTMIVSSSYTGAKLEVMGPQLAEFFGAQGSAGLLVRHVDPNTPAADAGMRAGDVVVKVNELPVTSANEWSKTIHENRGKTVMVVVLRDRKEQTLTLTPDSKKRSSVEPGVGLEEFFGDSDQAEQTRATLAELQPMFDAMAAQMHQRLEEVRATPEMLQMMAKLEAWGTNPEFQRQMQMARHQVEAAADAARLRADSPEFCQVRELRYQLRDMMRLN